MITMRKLILRIYNNHIDPRGDPLQAYGYWIVVFGMIIGIVGIGVFLFGSTYSRGQAAYWLFREIGIVLAAASLPISLFGFTLRLPLQPAASVLGSAGGLICVSAIVWFTVLYPFDWTFAGPTGTIVLYLLGLVVLSLSYTIVPMVVHPTTTTEPQRSTQPYYELEETAEGWTWRLYDQTGSILAESVERFPTRTAARETVYLLSTVSPTAGTAVITYNEA